MKKIVLLLAVGISLGACKMGTAKDEPKIEHGADLEKKLAALKDTTNLTTIEWLDSTYIEVGKVVKGQEVDVVYRFRNTGDKPLVIAQVTAGCGCTIPETPKEPYAPGAEGEIRARFNSANQSLGGHRKSVYVTANTKPNSYNILEFNVDVTER